MKVFLQCVSPLLCLACLTSLGQGQSALNRVEQGLRQSAAASQEPGYLGVVADDREENGRGIRVVEVVKGGPAELGGLRKGDLVVALNGKRVGLITDLGEVLVAGRVGTRLTFDVQRSNKLIRVQVVLGRRPAAKSRLAPDFGKIPESRPTQPSRSVPSLPSTQPLNTPNVGGAYLGVITVPMTRDDQARLRLPTTLGARIAEVRPTSPAARANLQRDDVIVSLGNTLVNRPSDLSAAIGRRRAGEQVDVSLFRAGRFVRLKVALTADAPAVTSRLKPIEELPDPNAVANRIPPPPADAAPRNGVPLPPQNNLEVPRLPSDQERLRHLEQVVVRLEARIAELEGRLRNKAAGAPPAKPDVLEKPPLLKLPKK
ncbi:MAG: PDZ domain-containing protein [Planctomycetales bacterium]